MSNLPELRESLVCAARRLEMGEPEDERRRTHAGRRFLGPVAALLGAAAAIAILVIAITSVSHGSGLTPTVAPQSQPSDAARQALARAGAERLLDHVALPPGATRVTSDPSSPAQFGAPEETLQLPHVVDVHRFWRLPGTVTRAANWLQSHPTAGGRLMSSEESGSSRGRRRRGRLSTISMWGGTYTFASVPPGLTAQQLTIEIAAAKGGGVAVRADGQAGWLPPRPVADQIPAGIRRIRVAYITRTDLGNGGLPGTSSTETRVEPFDITSAAHIRRVVAALNVLPHATRSALACHSRFGTEISLMFYGVARKTPLANARVFPNCSILVLAINGRPTQELSIAGAVVGPPLLFTLKPPQRSTSTTSTSSATSSSRAAGTTTR